MTSVQITSFAPSSSDFQRVLNVIQTPMPTTALNPTQVRIKMTLRPINPADIFSLLGVYPGFQPKQFPAHPGLEGVGVIVSVGSKVSSVKVGQRVIPGLWSLIQNGVGSWQAYVDCEETEAFPIPENVPDEAAAQIAINPLTVLGMLRQLNLAAGNYLLQTAAGSTLGRQVVAMAKAKGIKTINIIRRNDPGQIADLKQRGADQVIVTEGLSRDEIVHQIKVATGGKGADGALDAIAGESTGICVSSVKDKATVLLYGLMSGLEVKFHGPDALFRMVNVTGFWLAPFMMSLSIEQRRDLVNQAIQLFQQGVLDSFVGERFALKDVVKALEKQNQVGRGGKLFLE
jgi:NADPH:quinone reductase-like Zn-dependent oxidoreductase